MQLGHGLAFYAHEARSATVLHLLDLARFDPQEQYSTVPRNPDPSGLSRPPSYRDVAGNNFQSMERLCLASSAPCLKFPHEISCVSSVDVVLIYSSR